MDINKLQERVKQLYPGLCGVEAFRIPETGDWHLYLCKIDEKERPLGIRFTVQPCHLARFSEKSVCKLVALARNAFEEVVIK